MDVFGSIIRGADASTAGNILTPSAGNALKFGTETLIEGLPGNQVTSMDTGGAKRGINSAAAVTSGGDIADAAIQNQAAVRFNKIREKGSEALFNAGLRKAAPAVARFAASAPVKAALGPVGVGLATYDVVDAGVTALTGRDIHSHAVDPERVRGRWGAKHNKPY